MKKKTIEKICLKCQETNPYLFINCPYDMGQGDSLTKIPCYALVVLNKLLSRKYRYPTTQLKEIKEEDFG